LQRVGPAEEPGAGAVEERDAAQRVQDQEPRDREEDQGDRPQAEAGRGGQPQVTVPDNKKRKELRHLAKQRIYLRNFIFTETVFKKI
jgi:hypothetical protein